MSLKGKMPLNYEDAEKQTEQILSQMGGQNLLQERKLHELTKLLSEMSEELKTLRQYNEQCEKQLEAYDGKLKELKKIIHWRSDRLEMAMVHCIPRAQLSFEVALAEHCDLNCAGCDHFSPLAEPELADFEEVKKDFMQLSVLFKGCADKIQLLGGEPLLHPEITRFVEMARDAFPQSDISIVTNGIKLLHQPEAFWHACKRNRVALHITKYPIPLEFETMEERAEQYGVEYKYFSLTGSVEKTSDYYVLDPDGKQDGNRSFLLCHRANKCVYLAHGRIYTCTLAPSAKHFNRYFQTNLALSDEDSIDIYQAGSAEEILNFLARPIPFCRYCMPDKTRHGICWEQSKKDIKEWTL